MQVPLYKIGHYFLQQQTEQKEYKRSYAAQVELDNFTGAGNL